MNFKKLVIPLVASPSTSASTSRTGTPCPNPVSG
jgi:hypothetical protein